MWGKVVEDLFTSLDILINVSGQRILRRKKVL